MNQDSFNRAQANYDAMLPPDYSKREAAAEAIAEEIENDAERLHDLVYEDTLNNDEADCLATIRLLLRDCVPFLRKMCNGASVERSIAFPEHMTVFRELVRVCDTQDALIGELIRDEAELELDRRIEESRQ